MQRSERHPKLGLLHPVSVIVFLVLVALWLLAWLLPQPDGAAFRLVARVCGYLGALAMLVPYVHIARRWFRHRHLGETHRWMRWHLGAAYCAFFFVLIHSRGRANSGLTLVLLILLWIVMVSGVIGYYGQKLLYYLLPRLVSREHGLERLERQRQRLLDRARVLVADQHILDWKTFTEQLPPIVTQSLPDEASRRELDGAVRSVKRGGNEDLKEGIDHRAVVARAVLAALAAQDFTPAGDAELRPELVKLLETAKGRGLRPDEVRERNCLLLEAHYPKVVAPTRQVVRQFCAEALRDCFERPFTFWEWGQNRRPDDGLSRSSYEHVREFADPGKGEGLNQLWQLVEERRELDLEYRLHHLGRLWLLFHGPAAWALLVVMIEHIIMSMVYGGF